MKLDVFFMEYAREVSFQSTCYSTPKGAVIVKNDEIISCGFNNVPYGIQPCKLKYGYCYRRKLGYLTREGLQFCRGIHAEASSIVYAAKVGIPIENATLYTTHFPCNECAKLIINSGIKRIVYSEAYSTDSNIDIFSQTNIFIEQLELVHE
jgi:dCMP deaminase